MQKPFIFLVDYDDTILPSTQINSHSHSRPFHDIDEIAHFFLSSLISEGDVYIVTNATLSWIQESSIQYLPQTSKLLKTLNIISARDKYKRRYSDPELWKYHTFIDIINDLDYTPHSIISIGDSDYERFSLNRISLESYNVLLPMQSSIKYIRNKARNFVSLKMYNAPTVEELKYQLNFLHSKLEQIYDLEHLNDIKLIRYENEKGAFEDMPFYEQALKSIRSRVK